MSNSSLHLAGLVESHTLALPLPHLHHHVNCQLAIPEKRYVSCDAQLQI